MSQDRRELMDNDGSRGAHLKPLDASLLMPNMTLAVRQPRRGVLERQKALSERLAIENELDDNEAFTAQFISSNGPVARSEEETELKLVIKMTGKKDTGEPIYEVFEPSNRGVVSKNVPLKFPFKATKGLEKGKRGPTDQANQIFIEGSYELEEPKTETHIVPPPHSSFKGS